MYIKLLASSALALGVVGGALAQDTVAPAPLEPGAEAPQELQPEPPQEPLVEAEEAGINADGWLATEIIGADIFTGVGEESETIGEVNDFVLGENGQIAAVVVGVGGFLGIGQKDVAIKWADLELGMDPNGEQRLVSSMTREQLENAAEFNRAEWLASEQGGAAAPMDGDPMAPAPEGGDAMAPEGGAMAPEGGDAMLPEGDAGAEGEMTQQ
ncbi:PRC-barrel domain-containing protein [Pelagibacterium halotolerans]|uniref:PRC-barrel domain-containing protein n=1 Tax=Pelagibacterium halotolerans TaxID=531813 RepID=UPI00384F1709